MRRKIAKASKMLMVVAGLSLVSACHQDQQAAPTATIPSAKNSVTAINPRSYDTAYQHFYVLAMQGDPIAQNNLGRMYDEGRGVEVSTTDAIKWYTRAANQGLSEAKVNLAVAYLYGHGLQKSPRHACQLFNQAQHNGNSTAIRFYQRYCA